MVSFFARKRREEEMATVKDYIVGLFICLCALALAWLNGPRNFEWNP